MRRRSINERLILHDRKEEDEVVWGEIVTEIGRNLIKAGSLTKSRRGKRKRRRRAKARRKREQQKKK